MFVCFPREAGGWWRVSVWGKRRGVGAWGGGGWGGGGLYATLQLPGVAGDRGWVQLYGRCGLPNKVFPLHPSAAVLVPDDPSLRSSRCCRYCCWLELPSLKNPRDFIS